MLTAKEARRPAGATIGADPQRKDCAQRQSKAMFLAQDETPSNKQQATTHNHLDGQLEDAESNSAPQIERCPRHRNFRKVGSSLVEPEGYECRALRWLSTTPKHPEITNLRWICTLDTVADQWLCTALSLGVAKNTKTSSGA